jgi:uncharacterized protein (TIGR02266 family)
MMSQSLQGEEPREEHRPDERRQFQRATLKASVSLTSESNFYTGFMNDISEGGLFVATHNVIPRGSRMEIEFSLPDDDEPIHVLGEVRWVVEYNPLSDGHPGMGLQFVDLKEKDRVRIEQFVKMRGTLFYAD